jgi:hypothetical protein
MRWLIAVPVLASFLVGAGVGAEVVRPVPAIKDTALPLTITRDGQTTEAFCVLVKRIDQPARVTLYFATAAQLFKRNDGEPLPHAQSIVVHDGRTELDVIPADVTLPAGTLNDLAILQVVVPHSTLEPRPMTFDIPSPGSVFLIPGRDQHGDAVVIPQRVRHSSSGLVSGDRWTPELRRCLGAPAASEDGIFGIVSGCEPGQGPVVTPFSLARRWLTHHVPGLLAVPSPALTPFETSLQQFKVPLLGDSCTTTGNYEVDVPFTLRSDEVAIDAKVSLTERTAWPIGDLTVANVGSRFVRLRFVLTPAPHSLLPDPCTRSQPLANVQVTVLRIPR